MAATTISDLPRDALVLIFRAVFDAAKLDERYDIASHKIHYDLRHVSSDWRDAADIAFIEDQGNHVHLCITSSQDPSTVRLPFPSMVHTLSIARGYPEYGVQHCDASSTALALSGLCSSADLRRVLKRVSFSHMNCMSEVAAAVSAIAACSHLTSVDLQWMDHEHGHGVIHDVLAPLTTLTGLKELELATVSSRDGWPTFPDAPSLSSLKLHGVYATFAVMGSDASLGRLRRLSLSNHVTMGFHDQWASDDPLRLRADLDAGTWRPHMLTRVQELHISISTNGGPTNRSEPPRVFRGAAPAAAVWAPLAPTVTKLELYCGYSMYHETDLETGMYAGLGVLTGLQTLAVGCRDDQRCPVDFGRVHLPHLTSLSAEGYRGLPIDVTRFPRLAHVEITSPETDPLVLSSVAALGRLASLSVAGVYWGEPRDPLAHLNLAELFGGGRRLAALTELSFESVVLSWDAASSPGAPTAAEFATQARVLLPSLRSVEIKQEVEMDEGVREFVVPAMLALGRG